MIEIKRCKECEREYPATTEYYYKWKGYKDGLNPCCIDCYNAKQRDKRGKKPPLSEELKDGRMCKKCGKIYDLNLENFIPVNNGRGGFSARCRKCTREDARENYKKRKKHKKRQNVEGSQKTYLDTDLKTKNDKKAEAAYEKLINEPHNYGAKDDILAMKFKDGIAYKVESNSKNDGKRHNPEGVFEGKLIQETNEHITLRHLKGYSETFKKIDFITNEYTIREVI